MHWHTTRNHTAVRNIILLQPHHIIGCSGEENVSVVVAPIMPGFTLGALGGPDAAGRFFLDSIVAPPGSNKSAQLLGSAER